MMDFDKILTKEEALTGLINVWKFQRETERVGLSESLGRLSAGNVYSLNTLPLERVSAMDGFAVKSSTFLTGIPDVSTWKEGIDYVASDTGDDFPDDYDTVIPVEMLHYTDGEKLTLEDDFKFQSGSGIRRGGSYVEKGDLLLSKNTLITPMLLSALAMGGIREVEVYKRIKVSFIPSGSELIPYDKTPRRGRNVDSNSFLVSSCLKEWGGDVKCFDIVSDSPSSIEKALDSALLDSDIVLINGGSSKGGEDYTHTILEKRSTYFTHSVRTVPGRPVAIAIINSKVVINIPGPSLATWVVLDWLVRPLIAVWYGILPTERKSVMAILEEDLRKGPPVELYQMVYLEKKGEIYRAHPLSRDVKLAELLRLANGVIILPIGETGYAKGQSVRVELLCHESSIGFTEEEKKSIPDNCNECANHCKTSDLKCGRGRAHLESILNGEVFSDPLLNSFVSSSKAALHMAKMGRDGDGIFSALDKDERKEMLLLLIKLNQKWKCEHEERQKRKINR